MFFNFLNRDPFLESTNTLSTLIDSFATIIDSFKKNEGIFKLDKTYNLAVDKCTGEFIAVCEGDDYWPLDKLERQIKGFENSEVGLVWGNGSIDQNGKIFELKGFYGKYKTNILNNEPIGAAIVPFMFGHFFVMPTSAPMFRAKDLKSIKGYYQPDQLPWNDRPTWAYLACITKFKYLDENL